MATDRKQWLYGMRCERLSASGDGYCILPCILVVFVKND